MYIKIPSDWVTYGDIKITFVTTVHHTIRFFLLMRDNILLVGILYIIVSQKHGVYNISHIL